MSGGWKPRSALVAAIMPGPELLLLDEPTAGVDCIDRRDFRGRLYKLASEASFAPALGWLGRWVWLSELKGKDHEMSDIGQLAKDLRTDFPASPHERLAGYVVVKRTLDKCRSDIAGTNGEYHYDCPLDNMFFDFAGIGGDEFKEFVAGGGSDEEVEKWIQEKAKKREKREAIAWNNKMRYMRISELPIELQEFLEDYIPQYIPAEKRVRYWFDVYDIEEKRI